MNEITDGPSSQPHFANNNAIDNNGVVSGYADCEDEDESEKTDEEEEAYAHGDGENAEGEDEGDGDGEDGDGDNEEQGDFAELFQELQISGEAMARGGELESHMASNYSKIAKTEAYPDAARIYGKGTTFLERFADDQYAEQRAENNYFPLASKEEWEFTSVLMRMRCSLAEKSELLNTMLVCLKLVKRYILICYFR